MAIPPGDLTLGRCPWLPVYAALTITLPVPQYERSRSGFAGGPSPCLPFLFPRRHAGAVL